MTAPAPAAPAASPAPAVVPAAVVDPAKPPVVAAAPAAPAAAPAPVTDPAKPTALDPPADRAAPVKPGDFPDDWRAKLSKGDEKILKRLERYASPVAIAEALIHAQDRIAKGVKPTLAPNATPEEVKEYRALVGVPDKPEDYKIELKDGRVVGEDDKPLVSEFLKGMHAQNVPPAVVNAALNSYYEIQDAAIKKREDDDLDQKIACTDRLREEYGAEHKANMNAVHGLLATAPEGLSDQLFDARLPDGKLLFNSPEMVRWMVKMARDLNPAALVAPGSSANAAQTVGDELTALKADMGNSDSDYHTGPKVVKNGIKDTAKAHRYRELLEAQDRLQSSGRGARAA